MEQPLVLKDLLGCWSLLGLETKKLGEEVLGCRGQVLFDLLWQLVGRTANLVVQFLVGGAAIRELPT